MLKLLCLLGVGISALNMARRPPALRQVYGSITKALEVNPPEMSARVISQFMDSATRSAGLIIVSSVARAQQILVSAHLGMGYAAGLRQLLQHVFELGPLKLGITLVV